MTDTNGAHTATVETLTAEVRVLMVGSRQVTLSVAKQLDRIDAFGYGPDAITPFGRVKTGAKVTVERVKPKYRGYRRGDRLPLDAFESYIVEPWLEVIGRSDRDEDRGALVIFEVAELSEVDPEDAPTFGQWSRLPLIVLAGLR